MKTRNSKIKQPLGHLVAFYLTIAFFIFLFIAGLILFSYLFILCAAVALIIGAVFYIKEKLFPRKLKKSPPTTEPSKGRTIDHEK